MLNRCRVLLYLLKALHENNSYSRTKTDKLLFLFSKEYDFSDHIKFYHFFPYRYGPFSELFYHDMRTLEKQGYLINEKPSESGCIEASKIPDDLKIKIADALSRFPKLDNLKNYVYSRYPEYTVKSELLVMQKSHTEPGFFSIGYEGKDLDLFLDILIQNSIQVIADVRYNPFSMQFMFCQKNLSAHLKKVGINYLHFPELGIDGNLRKGLSDESNYNALFEMYRTDIFSQEKVKKIMELGERNRIALLCMEKDHIRCHRGVISRELEKLGFTVMHL